MIDMLELGSSKSREGRFTTLRGRILRRRLASGQQSSTASDAYAISSVNQLSQRIPLPVKSKFEIKVSHSTNPNMSSGKQKVNISYDV